MSDALRTAKLVIDLPVPGAEPFIMGIVQKVVVDENDEVTQVVPRQMEIHRRASKIALEPVTFTDPVTQQEYTITGAGLDELRGALRSAARQAGLDEAAAAGVMLNQRHLARLQAASACGHRG